VHLTNSNFCLVQHGNRWRANSDACTARPRAATAYIRTITATQLREPEWLI
jgi:hypothetical protein